MQNGMITAQPTPHHRPYVVLTSIILIPPSKSGKTRRRLARRLVGRQVCRLGGRVALYCTIETGLRLTTQVKLVRHQFTVRLWHGTCMAPAI